MTVQTTSITSGPYTGNNLADAYDYDFPITANTELVVFETDLAGVVTTLTLSTDYTVTGVGSASGTVVRVAGNLPTGYKWYIRSNIPDTQLIDFSSQGGFFPDIHEAAIDKLTLISQQFNDLSNRSLRFSDSYSGGADAELPDSVPEAYIRWSNDGLNLENDTTIPDGVATTAANVLLSNADVLITNADVVTTTADKAAAAQSALNAATYAVFNKYNATTAPGVTDDGVDTSGNGIFVVGSEWVDVSTDLSYKCMDVATGAAIWSGTNAGGATDAQAAQITLNAFNIAVNGGLSVGNMIDGVADTFTDATGTDTDVKQPAKGGGKYTLKTEGGFALAAATYSSESFDVSSQDIAPTSITWNIDGTKFFIVGDANNTLFEYTCSVGFDLSSTVAYSGESVASLRDTNPTDIAWNADGTKFFLLGTNADSVDEYTCSVGFDLSSTVAYASRTFSVASQENAPQGIAFSPDGLKFFIVGTQNDTVYEYTIPTAFLLTGAAYSGRSFSVASQDANPKNIAFNLDGTKFFIAGGSGNDILEYDVSVGFDLSSAVTYSGNSFSISGQESGSGIGGLSFSADGAKFFIVGLTADTVFEYSVNGAQSSALTTADFTALAAPDSALVVLHQNPSTSITLNTDLQAWVSRTTPKDFTTDGGTDNKIYVTAHGWSNGQEILLSESVVGLIPAALNTHTPYFIINQTTNSFEVSLTSGGAAIVTSAAAVSANISLGIDTGISVSLVSQDTQPAGFSWNDDGLKFYMVGDTNNTIYEYSCSVAYDLSSTVAYTSNSFSTASQQTNPADIAWNADGTKFILCGQTPNSVHEYTVSVGFDLGSTVAYSGNTQAVTAAAGCIGVAMNTDGTKLFALGGSNDIIHEYSLSVGFDLSSTFTYSTYTLSIASEDTGPTGFCFNSDGTKLYAVGSVTKALYEYSLSTGFDFNSTTAYTGYSLSISSMTTPYDITFNAAYDKFYVMDVTARLVHEYTLSVTLTTSVYSQATLALDAEQSTGSIVSGTADLSTQVSGTAIHTAIITPTQTAIDLFALSTQWS